MSPSKGPGQGSLAGAEQGDPLASLSRQIIVAVTAWLLACAAVAWVLVARRADTMSGMISGLAQVGTRMPMTIAAPAFLAMWVGMMVAMMFPTAVPLVAAHHVVVRRRERASCPPLPSWPGYLLTWSAAGLLPLAALLMFRRLSGAVGDSRWLPFLAGLTLTIAGLYQFSRRQLRAQHVR